MTQDQPEQRGYSGWLLLLVPLIATLGAGAFFGRAYLDGRSTSTELAVTGSSHGEDPSEALFGAGSSSALPSPGGAAPAATASAPNNVDLGTITGRYLLRGPNQAPSGSVVVFVLAGPKRAVHTDAEEPFSFPFDSAKIPNGTYTVGITLIRPGLAPLSKTQLMEIANPSASQKQAAAPSPGSTKPAATKAPGSGAVTATSSSGMAAQAADVLALTNTRRAAAGCKPVKANSTLTAVAQAHSADMAKHNYFTHESQDGTTPFQRISAAGYRYRGAAENIAYGQATAAAVMDVWMKSAGHKANILNCAYTELGVGYAVRAGVPYWTQDFGTPM